MYSDLLAKFVYVVRFYTDMLTHRVTIPAFVVCVGLLFFVSRLSPVCFYNGSSGLSAFTHVRAFCGWGLHPKASANQHVVAMLMPPCRPVCDSLSAWWPLLRRWFLEISCCSSSIKSLSSSELACVSLLNCSYLSSSATDFSVKVSHSTQTRPLNGLFSNRSGGFNSTQALPGMTAVHSQPSSSLAAPADYATVSTCWDVLTQSMHEGLVDHTDTTSG